MSLPKKKKTITGSSPSLLPPIPPSTTQVSTQYFVMPLGGRNICASVLLTDRKVMQMLKPVSKPALLH